MSTLIFQIVTLLLGAFLVGCASGCFARSRYVLLTRAAPALPGESEEDIASASSSAEGGEAASDAPQDDLTRIQGIGPAAERQLRELGIRRFGQIARWSEAEIDRMEEQLGTTGRIRQEDWVGQAKRLSDGDPPPPQ